MERDSRDQRKMNDSNGCKIAGIRRARPQRPTRGCNTGKPRVGSATYRGIGDQHRPPQYCIEIQIQSPIRRGVYPRSAANTCHIGCRTIMKVREGAGRIDGHGQSWDDQAATVVTAKDGSSTLPFEDRQGERKRRHDHGQKRPRTTKGTAQTKIKIKATQLPLTLPVYFAITNPPPPRDEK